MASSNPATRNLATPCHHDTMPPLTLQRQGKYECALACIAMLARAPLAEVRHIACQFAGIGEWVEMMDGRHHGLVFDLLAQVGNWFGISEFADKAAMPLLSERMPAGPDPDLTGEGTILVEGHIVVFKAGLVYDPSLDSPLPYCEWRKVETRPIVKIWHRNA